MLEKYKQAKYKHTKKYKHARKLQTRLRTNLYNAQVQKVASEQYNPNGPN